MLAEAAEMPRRRRQWTREEKRRIVELARAPGASVARVARMNGVNANQVYTWLRQQERGLVGEAQPETALLPVRIVEDEAPVSVVAVTRSRVPANQVERTRRARPAGVMLVETSKGRLKVRGAADSAALRIALECLLA